MGTSHPARPGEILHVRAEEVIVLRDVDPRSVGQLRQRDRVQRRRAVAHVLHRRGRVKLAHQLRLDGELDVVHVHLRAAAVLRVRHAVAQHLRGVACAVDGRERRVRGQSARREEEGTRDDATPCREEENESTLSARAREDDRSARSIERTHGG
eukprot:30829-Pelagococcus_subviridis.AAC.2